VSKTPGSCSQSGYSDICLIRQMLGVDVGQGIKLDNTTGQSLGTFSAPLA